MILNDFVKRFMTFLSIDIFVKAGGFLLLPLYLQLMSTEEFGIFSYALSLASALSFVIGTGQHIVVSRFYHSGEYNKKNIAETILATLMMVTFLYTLVAIIFKTELVNFFFTTPISSLLFYSIFYLSLMQALNQILMTYLYQKESVGTVKKKNIFEFFFTHSLAIFLLYQFSNIVPEVRLIAISLAFTFIIIFMGTRRYNLQSLKLENFSQKLFKRGLLSGVPVAIGSVSNIFISLGDRYTIEKLLDPHQLGVYSLAVSLCNILFILFYSFQGAWWPVVFKEKNLRLSLSRIHKVYLIFLGVSIVFGAFVYPGVILLTKVGVDIRYLATLDFIWILVLSTLFQICGMLISSMYEIYEKTYLGVMINIAFSILNIVLNTYLVSIYGLKGAAFATLCVSLGLFAVNYGVVRLMLSKNAKGNYYQSN